ncbi:MAG: D-alanyl-D-alanine carboxypeptidase family protein [Ruminococcus sp.]|nr:D-alanyl-D-alanine carboxypeptidase family protein [Ruminococcus sp.]
MKLERFIASALSAAVVGICAVSATAFAEEEIDIVQSQAISGRGAVADILASDKKSSLGDVNGDGTIDATDASDILVEYSILSTGGTGKLTGEAFRAADVNKDGVINASDASNVLEYYSYLSTGGKGSLEAYFGVQPVVTTTAAAAVPKTTATTAAVLSTTAAPKTTVAPPKTTAAPPKTTAAPPKTTAAPPPTTTAVPPTTTAVPPTTAPVTTVKPDVVTEPSNKVSSIKLSKTELNLSVGEGDISYVTMLPATAWNKAEKWTSSDESIAVVDGEGWVVGLKEGTCVVTVTSVDNPNVKAEIKVNVHDPNKVTGIRVSKTSLNIAVGEGDISYVTILPGSASDKGEIWTTSDESIATVDSEGWVVGKKPGKCVVTVACHGDPTISADIIVTVYGNDPPVTEVPVVTTTEPPVTVTEPVVTTTQPVTTSDPVTTTKDPSAVSEIKLDKTSMNIETGKGAGARVTILPETAVDKSLVWESSDDSIASVSSDGWIMGKKEGSCVVTVTSSSSRDVKAQLIVNVKAPDPTKVQEISLSRYEVEIPLATCDLSAWVTMLPDTAYNKAEKWVCSDESIASVDQDGWVYGRKLGECTVTVSSVDNPEVKADIKVKIVSSLSTTSATTTATTESTQSPVVVIDTTTTPTVIPISVENHNVEVRNGVTYIDGMLIVNKTYALPQNFAPGMNSTASNQFSKLSAAAAEDGLNIYFTSGYRSYIAQQELYNNYVAQDGQAAAERYSARPGHSEHQSGLAIDVNNPDDSFAGTPEAKWLEEHAHEYGFIIRYPEGKESITGYKYEPWHIRFVGIQTAAKIHNSGKCLEEYLGIDSFYQS